MSQDDKDHFEGLAALSAHRAKHNRALRKAALHMPEQVAAILDEPPAAPAQAQADDQLVPHLPSRIVVSQALVRLNDFEPEAVLASEVEMYTKRCSEAWRSTGAQSASPVSIAAFEKHFRSSGHPKQKHSITAEASAFVRECTHISSGDPAFPANVEYPTVCGACCKQRTSLDILATRTSSAHTEDSSH